jgi:hypothetical protein
MHEDVPNRRCTWHLVVALAGLTCLGAAPVPTASEPSHGAAKSPPGRPKVHLDRLEFPTNVRDHDALKRHLRRVLQREVRRVEWGAGRDNRIEYRFAVTKLALETQNGVLKVSCAATGTLPGGKTAHSKLTFGGAPEQRNQVVKQVLEIVARGVIARLAELERHRRGLS